MSEKNTPLHEKQEVAVDQHEFRKREQEALNQAKNEAAMAENEAANKIEEIRDLVNKQAIETSKHESSEQRAQGEPEGADTYWYSREYRELAFKQLMGRVRKHMSGPQKAASKIIHQPTIEKLSDIGEKTVARTSGVLAGSIFSFIASLGTYYLSRHNGYDMTYAIFFASFLGGFVFGVLVEFGYKSIRALLSRS